MPRSSVITAIVKEVEESAFSPIDVSGLQLWLDASDASTITESGGNVSQWDDKSGNANHVNQGTLANQPVTGTRTINLLNVLDFDGTNSFLSQTNIQLVNSSTGHFTAFGVSRNDVSTVGMIISQDNSGDQVAQFIKTGVNAAGIAFNTLGNTFQDSSNKPVGTSPVVISSVFNGSTIEVLVNRETKGGTSFFGTTKKNASTVTVGGTRPDISNERFNGSIAELIIYNRVLENEEIESVEQYLADKWGVSLP